MSLGVGESLLIRFDMVTRGQKGDHEASFFGEPLQLATRGLQMAEFGGESGGRAGEGNSPGFNGGEGVETEG